MNFARLRHLQRGPTFETKKTPSSSAWRKCQRNNARKLGGHIVDLVAVVSQKLREFTTGSFKLQCFSGIQLASGCLYF